MHAAIAGIVPGRVNVMHGKARPHQGFQPVHQRRIGGQQPHLLIGNQEAVVIGLAIFDQLIDFGDKPGVEIGFDKARQDQIALAVKKFDVGSTEALLSFSHLNFSFY